MKFKIHCSQLKLYWNTVTLIHVHIIYGCFCITWQRWVVVTKWPAKPNIFIVSVFKFADPHYREWKVNTHFPRDICKGRGKPCDPVLTNKMSRKVCKRDGRKDSVDPNKVKEESWLLSTSSCLKHRCDVWSCGDIFVTTMTQAQGWLHFYLIYYFFVQRSNAFFGLWCWNWFEAVYSFSKPSLNNGHWGKNNLRQMLPMGNFPFL